MFANHPDVENTTTNTNHPDVEDVVGKQSHTISTAQRGEIGKKVVTRKSHKARLGWGKKETYDNEKGWNPRER